MATFDPAAMLRAVARHQVDELICVPAMTTRLLEEARSGQYDLDHLTTMFSSGAAHSPDIWQEIYDVLAVDEIFTAYGQTETTASTACTRPGDPIERLKTTNGAIKLAGNDKLRIDREYADPKDRAQYIRDVLRVLGPPTGTSPS